MAIIPDVLSEFAELLDQDYDLAMEESNWFGQQNTREMLQMLHTHQAVTAVANTNNRQSFVSAPAQQAPSTTHIFMLSAPPTVQQQPMMQMMPMMNTHQLIDSRDLTMLLNAAAASCSNNFPAPVAPPAAPVVTSAPTSNGPITIYLMAGGAQMPLSNGVTRLVDSKDQSLSVRTTQTETALPAVNSYTQQIVN